MATDSNQAKSRRFKIDLNVEHGKPLVPNGGVSRLIGILSSPTASKKTIDLAKKSGYDPSKMADKLKEKAWKGKRLDGILEELH